MCVHKSSIIHFHVFYSLSFPMQQVGSYCMNRFDHTNMLLHVKESNGKTFTVHSSLVVNSYIQYLTFLGASSHAIAFGTTKNR